MERKSYTSSQVKNCFQRLSQLEKIIFEISNTSLEDSVQTVFDLLESDYPYSSNLLICKFIYASFVSQKRFLNRYFRFMKLIDIKVNKKIFSLFANFLDRENSQEAFYILEILNEKKLIEPYYVERNASLFFVHHMSLREIKNAIEFNRSMFCTRFKENIEELSKNDWELHKKYVKEGHNPNEIAKIIRNDKIEKLQEISSQTNFDFNQTIEPSLYERCSFINQRKVTLIDYAAFFSSVKCFKYLLMNGCNIEDTLKYAIAGGNLEIIHLCEQNHSSYKGAYEAAIEFHRNDIVKYYYDNKIIEINDLKELGIECIYYHNYIIFSFLIDEGMKITNFNMELSGISNIFLIELFYDEKQIQKDSLISFSDKGNIELVEYLLHKGFDVNAKNIYRFYLYFIPII